MANFFAPRPLLRHRLLCLLALCFPVPGSHGQACRPPAAKAPRILVVGGGGARGAWGGGFVQHLVRDENGGRPYDVVFGTSTGSLMAPFIALNDFATLKTAYTSVTQESIFDVNPFDEKTGKLRAFNAAWRAICGKESFGESHNLHQLIDRLVTDARYTAIRTTGKEFTVCVLDMSSGQPLYKSSRDIASRPAMVNWIWASANEPLFMSYYKVGAQVFVDGGVRENVPLAEAYRYACDHGARRIDVVVNKPFDPLTKTFPKQDVLSGLLRLIDLWNLEVRDNDLLIPRLLSLAGVRGLVSQRSQGTEAEKANLFFINIHYFPPALYHKLYDGEPLAQKELLFDKTRMLEWWAAGDRGEKDTSVQTDATGRVMLAAPTETIVLPMDVIDALLQRK